MVKKKKKKKVISCELIEQHAEKLFIKNGVEKTSVNEIVQCTGIAKGTFYLYFKNKDELVDSIITRYTKDFLEKVLMPHGDGDELKIKPLSEAIIEYFSKNHFYLEELRRNLTGNCSYTATTRTIEAFRSIVSIYINKIDEYKISDWDTFTRILLGMVLDVSYRAIINDEIKNPDDASIMLGNILKRFFSCT